MTRKEQLHPRLCLNLDVSGYQVEAQVGLSIVAWGLTSEYAWLCAHWSDGSNSSFQGTTSDASYERSHDINPAK